MTTTAGKILLLMNTRPYFTRSEFSAAQGLVQLWPLDDASGTLARGTVVTPGNICDNGDLETWAAGVPSYGWQIDGADGSVTQEGSVVHGGASAAKLLAGATMNARLLLNIFVKPGESLTLTFWTRGDGTNAGRFYVRDNTNSAFIINIGSTGVTGTTYTQVTRTFTVPATCLQIALGFYCPALNTAFNYIDDIVMQSADASWGRYIAAPTLAQPGFTRGAKSVLFNGTSQFVNLYNAVLRNTLNTLVTGTALIWVKIDAATWADGLTRYLLRFKSSGTAPLNASVVSKVNNTIDFQYIDSTVNIAYALDVGSPTGWIALAWTWEQGVGTNFYINKVLVHTDVVGNWVAPFDIHNILIGSESDGAGAKWIKGYASTAALWNKALTQSQIAEVSTP